MYLDPQHSRQPWLKKSASHADTANRRYGRICHKRLRQLRTIIHERPGPLRANTHKRLRPLQGCCLGHDLLDEGGGREDFRKPNLDRQINKRSLGY